MKNHRLPLFRFSFASPRGARPIDEQSLDMLLPLVRPSSGQSAPGKITYRVYLQGIQACILGHWDQFVQAVSEQAAGPVNSINLIEVVAEKHGSDYHPARIRVSANGITLCFVANVAVTERGKKRLAKDYHWLKSLRQQFRNHFVPRTYFLTRQEVLDADGQETDLVMFLAEWLEGYHEFHLSRNVERDTLETVVWDMDEGHRFLPETRSQEIYRQSAFILTYYYDVQTFREVFPWHHASGDFVVHLGRDALNVKLITVRQYEPRTVFHEDTPENIMTALTIFLANLTVRMRLDRIDGTGVVAWVGDHCVEATIQGFLDAMEEKVIQGHCSPSVVGELTRALKAMSVAEWAELFRFVVDSYDESAPDVPVITENLADHVFRVYSMIHSGYEQP